MNNLPSNYVWTSQQNWEPGQIQLTKDDRVLHETVRKVREGADIDEMLFISVRYADLLIDRMVRSV